MTRFSVEILPQAEAEIREAFLWQFERSPLAADAFRTAVFGVRPTLAGLGAVDAARIGGGWLVDQFAAARVGVHACSLAGAVLLMLNTALIGSRGARGFLTYDIG